ncbi:MAG: DUF3012 domain-containing protein [Magnetococcales bacterium]|nr:DUF3012 domain-containing protein [Magnetococcales bacterium]
MTQQTMKKFCAEMLQEEVGTKVWCEQIKTKPKADWTPNDAVVYAQSCIL